MKGPVAFVIAFLIAFGSWYFLVHYEGPAPGDLGGTHVAENPEGEADPAVMKLGMKTWVWQSALYNDGRTLVPKAQGRFTLTFHNDGSFSAHTDCNSMGGSYGTVGSIIKFENISVTQMACQNSQEGDFMQLLQSASNYHFTSRGELILDLKFDSGSVVFR